MDRLTSKQLRDLLDFLRAGYACHDQESFITHLLVGVQPLIPSEITGYNELHLEDGRALEATRIEPSTAKFPEYWQIFEQYLPEHPFATYLQQTRDRHPIKISDFLTRHQFHRLGLYNEFFRRQGVEHQMAASLASPAPREIAITLNRSKGDFSERERLLLDLLRPHLTQAYANVQAITTMRQEVRLSRQAVQASGREMVTLTKEGRVRLMAPRAHRWLAMYFGPTKADRLPDALRAWLTHQEVVLGRADEVPLPREPLQVERNGTCLLVRHLCEADQCLLLLEERQTTSEAVSFERDGLTRREAEVLQWVAQGKTNAEIGCILDMSPRTVQKHLEHIFEKLGVETRTAAATLAMGWCSGGLV